MTDCTVPSTEDIRVSLIIPTLNEAENLPHVLAEIPATVSEIILVDGGSTDGTVDLVLRQWPNVHVVRQSSTGKGNGLQLGLAGC